MRLSTFLHRSPIFSDMAILAIAAAVVTLPILIWGIPIGNDLSQHYQFAMAVHETAVRGNFFPSWNGSANFGFGDAGLRFYPLLSYYVLNLFYSLTGEWFGASVIAFYFLFALGGTGLYFWARESFDRVPSLIGAVSYMVLPYHVNQLYNAFFYAEFAASSLIPFCFLAVTRVCRKVTVVNVVALAISYALLFLTHLPTAMIASIALVFFSIFLLRADEWRKTIVALVISAAASLLATGFYLARLVIETQFVQHAGEEFSQRDFSYSSNFLFAYFWASADDYADRSLWFGDAMLFLTLICAVPAAIVGWKKLQPLARLPVAAAFAVLFLGVFFATPISAPVWKYVPLIAKIQFPFRWLVVISAGSAFLIASAVDPVREIWGTRLRPVAILMIGALSVTVAFSAFQIIRPAIFIPRTAFAERLIALETTESCECWWPIWAKRSALEQRVPASAEGRAIVVERESPNLWGMIVDAGRPVPMRVSAFYYPHWKARINGEQVTPTVAADGTILIDLPPDRAAVSMVFVEPPLIRILGWVSVVVWVAFFVYLIFRSARPFLASKAD